MKTMKLLFLFLLGVLPMQAQDSEEGCFEGTVTNQDGNPVSDAEVCIYRNLETGTDVNDVEYFATTDAAGHFKVIIDKSKNIYPKNYFYMTVKAKGYPSYEYQMGFTLDRSYSNYFPKEITLWNRLDFIKDQLGTIILPETPDPTLGRYYRYDHFGTDGHSLIFVREEEPKANVPYVIFPNSDFSIDLTQYDLDNLPDPSFVPLFPDETYKISGFYGFYTSYAGWYCHYVIDDTPDCCRDDTGIVPIPRIGPFRACLLAELWVTTMVFESTSIPISKEPTGISSVKLAPDASAFFDLQGRRIQGEPQKKGVYIRGGRKYVKK